jgi:hypothetical protein
MLNKEKIFSTKLNFRPIYLVFACQGEVQGLPGGIFSYPKSRLGYILENLVMENGDIFYVGTLEIFYDYLVYFMANWSIM